MMSRGGTPKRWEGDHREATFSSASHFPTVNSLVFSAHRGTEADQVHSGRVYLGNGCWPPFLAATANFLNPISFGFRVREEPHPGGEWRTHETFHL